MSEENSKSEKVMKAALIIGKGTFKVTKVTLETTGKLSVPVAKQGKRLAGKGAKASAKYAQDKMAEHAENNAPTSMENWYQKASVVCGTTADAILNQKKGASERAIILLASKLGGAGATVGVFSIASLLGTASTGTAISTLSGAAFQNAALAWIGGSVAAGTSIMLGVAFVGGAVAFFGARHGLTKITGKKRKKTDLDNQELRVVDTLIYLATSFRQHHKCQHRLDPMSASALHNETLELLCSELETCFNKISDWPALPKNRLQKEILKIVELKQFLKNEMQDAGHQAGMIGVPISTGIVSATILKILVNDLPTFSEKEELVLVALRRSNNDLSDASNEELAEYVQAMSVEQIPGLTNNVKGIYHELSFQHQENNDGDEYIVELFETTNHPGADVRIINTETGEVTTAQLKATNYAAYVRAHNEQYEDISVFATSEVADNDASISSSGLSNEDMTRETEAVLDALAGSSKADVLDSMGVAAMMTLARNAGALLKGETISSKSKEKMIQDGIVTASVAGLTNLIL